MAQKTIAELQAIFITGATPTQQDFADFIESAVRPYKVYTAVLNQSGGSDPAETILTNTLGFAPLWLRDGTGQYKGQQIGGFPIGKTFLLTSGNRNIEATQFIGAYIGDPDAVLIRTGDGIGNLADGYLIDFCIEIRVYP